jgi:hypothetical protein
MVETGPPLSSVCPAALPGRAAHIVEREAGTVKPVAVDITARLTANDLHMRVD